MSDTESSASPTEGQLRAPIAAGSRNVGDYLQLATHLKHTSRFQEAAEIYEQGLRLNLDDIDKARLAWELGELLDKVMGRSAEAVGLAQNVISLLLDKPDSIDILTLRARSYTLLAHALWPERPEAALNAARQAVERLDNLIALHPDTDDIGVLLGDAAWVHTSLGNVDRAIALCVQYLRREPGPRHRVVALMLLAEALRLATRFRDAERAVAEVLESPELDPLAHPVLYNTLGLIHRGANEPLKAQQAFEMSLKSLRAHPFQSSSKELLKTVYGNLGELHYEAGDFDAALRCFEVLLEQYPSGSSAYHRTLNCLGDCHAARGSYSEARRYYHQVLDSATAETEQRVSANDGLALLPC